MVRLVSTQQPVALQQGWLGSVRRGISHTPCLLGVLLCSGSRLISGSNTKRLRLWAVGVVPELRRKGSSAR